MKFKEGMYLKVKPELLEKPWFKGFKETDVLLTYKTQYGELWAKDINNHNKIISVKPHLQDYSTEFYEYTWIEYEEVVNGV